MGKWSNLPADLLYVIEDHVVLYIDKVRIRAVSLEWYSYLPKLPDHRATEIPFLLHPLEDNDDEDATHGLFNPLDDKVYKIYAPEASVKLFKGSSHGWIVTTEDFHSRNPNDICLINPITRAQIKLPPKTEFYDVLRYCPDKVGQEFIVRMFFDFSSDYVFHEDFVDEFTLNHYYMSLALTLKVVFSCAPNNDDCVVIATYGSNGYLAWCRINDKSWTPIHTNGINTYAHIMDILYLNGCLYVLNEDGQVFMFENIGTKLDIKFKELTTDRVPVTPNGYGYLSECSDGSLIVAARHMVYDPNWVHTKEFKVYKLISNYPSSNWVELKNIDDALFVGFGSIRLISSSNSVGFKRNHIYFSDSITSLDTYENSKNMKSDVGVFSLEDGTLKSLQGLGDFVWPRPIWTIIC